MASSHWSVFIEDVLIPAILLLLVITSQIFWIRRARELGRELIRASAWRKRVAVALLSFFVLVWLYSIASLWVHGSAHTRLETSDAVLTAPFAWWVFGSVIGFLLVVILRLPAYLVRAIQWMYRGTHRGIPASAGVVWRRLAARRGVLSPNSGPSPQSAKWAARPVIASGHSVPTSRRRFLEQATLAVGTVPFIAAFYGLVFERTAIETTRHRVELDRLPRSFDGFRIAQLSDLHIGPFMSAAEIRHCVRMTQRLKPDLILLTGDYVIWDPSTQGAVVDALSGLSAPYGVFGSLGNHEMWTGAEDSITRLFTAQGTRILRTENATVRAGDGELNLIGVDFQARRPMGEHHEGIVHQYLAGVGPLVRSDTVNILLSHNPNTFDRAAELGIDLSLAGHTHGGQVALEFISPQISPSRLVTPYVAGWFRKPGASLYVNRGIGTIGVPMRMGAPPEITVYDLARKVT